MILCPTLAGRRVLVVEDEPLVAMIIEELLADQRSVVLGPFARLEPAVKAACSADIDIALLDVSFGVMVYTVAETLDVRGIPFLLLSNYGSVAPVDHPEWNLCRKPFYQKDLLEMMLEQLAGALA